MLFETYINIVKINTEQKKNAIVIILSEDITGFQTETKKQHKRFEIKYKRKVN